MTGHARNFYDTTSKETLMSYQSTTGSEFSLFSNDLLPTNDLEFNKEAQLRGKINFVDWYDRLENCFNRSHPTVERFLDGIAVYTEKWSRYKIENYYKNINDFINTVLKDTVRPELLQIYDESLKGIYLFNFILSENIVPPSRVRRYNKLQLIIYNLTSFQLTNAKIFHYGRVLINESFLGLGPLEIVGLLSCILSKNEKYRKSMINGTTNFNDPLYYDENEIKFNQRKILTGSSDYYKWLWHFHRCIYLENKRSYYYLNGMPTFPDTLNEQQTQKFTTQTNKFISEYIKSSTSPEIWETVKSYPGYVQFKKLKKRFTSGLTNRRRFNLLKRILNKLTSEEEEISERYFEKLSFFLGNYVFINYSTEEIVTLLCIYWMKDPEIEDKIIDGEYPLNMDSLKVIINGQIMFHYELKSGFSPGSENMYEHYTF